MPEPIVLFGGSFDPVHYGHLRAVQEAAEQLGVEQVKLLPCHIPPHKESLKASVSQRLHMLQLAIAEQPNLSVDTWELEQPKASYTLNTLKRYRASYGDEISLIFLMGWDSLQSLPSWYHWQELAELSNFAVWRRPGYSELNHQVQAWLDTRLSEVADLKNQSSGHVCFLQTTPLDVSSSAVRNGDAMNTELLPESVYRYIRECNLYQTKAGKMNVN